MRLLAGAIRWVSGAPYRPRYEALAGVYDALVAGRAATLSGCHMTDRRGEWRIAREYEAVRDVVCAPGAEWDGRWIVEGPDSGAEAIRALGNDGLAACPDWRAAGLPRTTLLASPSVWRDGRLVAAPMAGMPGNYVVKPGTNRPDFITSLLVH